jgi:hypothetical protein
MTRMGATEPAFYQPALRHDERPSQSDRFRSANVDCNKGITARRSSGRATSLSFAHGPRDAVAVATDSVASKLAPMRTASCSCGQLKVTCEGEPIRISMCHCLSIDGNVEGLGRGSLRLAPIWRARDSWAARSRQYSQCCSKWPSRNWPRPPSCDRAREPGPPVSLALRAGRGRCVREAPRVTSTA